MKIHPHAFANTYDFHYSVGNAYKKGKYRLKLTHFTRQ